jgi:Cys-rich repeat protein
MWFYRIGGALVIVVSTLLLARACNGGDKNKDISTRQALVKSIEARREAPPAPIEDYEDDWQEETELRADSVLPPGFLHCESNIEDCVECHADYDCPEGQACRLNQKTHRVQCVESGCTANADCPSGQQCVRIDDGSVGAVRGCEATGPRGRGQTCSRYDAQVTCGLGLECLGGICRGSCTEGCPDDETCVEINDRKACVSVSCDGIDCPYSDQRCINGQCIRGLDCRTDTCPEGGTCLTMGRGLSWTGACYQPCSLWKPCPEGEVCGLFGVCLRACDPQDLESCEEGFQCQSSAEMPGVWGCSPQ